MSDFDLFLKALVETLEEWKEKGVPTRIIRLTCDQCGAMLRIELRSGLTIDGEYLRCPCCGGHQFTFKEVAK